MAIHKHNFDHLQYTEEAIEVLVDLHVGMIRAFAKCKTREAAHKFYNEHPPIKEVIDHHFEYAGIPANFNNPIIHIDDIYHQAFSDFLWAVCHVAYMQACGCADYDLEARRQRR